MNETRAYIPADTIPTVIMSPQIQPIRSRYNSFRNTVRIGDYREPTRNTYHFEFECSFQFEIQDAFVKELRAYLKEVKIPFVAKKNYFAISWEDAMNLYQQIRQEQYESPFKMKLFQMLLERLDAAFYLPYDFKSTWLEATRHYRTYLDRDKHAAKNIPRNELIVHEVTHAMYLSNLWNGKLRLANLASDDDAFTSYAPSLKRIDVLAEAEAIGRGVFQSFTSVDHLQNPYTFYLQVAQALNLVPYLMGISSSVFTNIDEHAAGAILLLQGSGLSQLFTIASHMSWVTRKQLCLDLSNSAMQILQDPESLRIKLRDALPQIHPLIEGLIADLDTEVAHIDARSLSKTAKSAVRKYQRILQLESLTAHV